MAVKVSIISLGCSKNLVDSETMLGLLAKKGFTLCGEINDADVVVINTCGFITPAKEEAIDTILEIIDLKNEGIIKGIVVCGCLSQRYRDSMKEEFPEVDAFLGTTSESQIVNAAICAYENKPYEQYDGENDEPFFDDRVLSTPPYTAYLKIAEGCDNRCSYCAIPIIRGGFRSVPIEKLINQAKSLALNGVKELCVVAQDPTNYGIDLYGERCLTELLDELCKTDGIEWIRLLYLYPDKIDDKLLQFMQANDKIVKYIDMPIQHCEGRILKAMHRPGNREKLTSLIEKIREMMPGIALRSTVIAGFPGETEEEFASLCEFLKEVRFERLGAFAYSPEEDTPAAEFDSQIDDDVKNRRAEILMEIQNPISQSILEGKKGSILKVLTEGYDEESECYTGRSYMDAPEVDGKVYFTAYRDLTPGEFAFVSITGCLDYDLTGEMI